ncbi:Ribonuclease P, Rpp40 [Metarhizium rileyi]|uniref:Ribonuclease P, Rpp40 n=1 Tax=Metarhizium rileyi (strain RCEF 4871) TaxID=1649241 RepID=A0A167APN1_METRR|nr:Ribonuclease P, Rpp40 [Metarhizium rileyi RCEF 4871]
MRPTGEIFMFSEGDSMFATTYSIKDGIVTIHMEKEIFERAGLPGKPLVDNIRGNGQARWVVSMDLGSLTTFPDGRVPDSLLHACSTVLTERSLWLFCLKNGSALNEKLWEALQINQCSITSRLSQKTLALPELILTAPPAATDGVGFEERAIATYEWLSLVRLESPRIEPKDAIDPYLSRYYIKGKTSDPLHICKITWQGLIGTSWLRDLARDAMALCPQQDWFSIIATKSCCIEMGIHAESVLLRPSGNGSQYLLWQIDRHR